MNSRTSEGATFDSSFRVRGSTNSSLRHPLSSIKHECFVELRLIVGALAVEKFKGAQRLIVEGLLFDAAPLRRSSTHAAHTRGRVEGRPYHDVSL